MRTQSVIAALIFTFIAGKQAHGQTNAGFTAPQASADSVRRHEVRPGITHTEYTLDGPFTLDVVTLEMHRDDYSLESHKPDSLTPTSQQVRQAGENGLDVVAGINADFFSFKTHWPVGNQVADGFPVTGLKTSRTHVSITANGGVRFGPAGFAGTVLVRGQILSLDGLNSHDSAGSTFLFTPFWGVSTRSNESKTDVRLKLLSEGWQFGDTMTFVARDIDEDGDAVFGDAEAILSFGDGLATISRNDTLRMVLSYGDHTGFIRTMLGGAGTILENGTYPFEGNREKESIGKRFIIDRHPRTFVAIDRDTTTFFLCTVDGRQSSSMGMNFREMAGFLLSIGAWNAINLDGGGSTTMIVNGQIVNSPSDKTGERPVANSLMIIDKKKRRDR